MNFIIKVEGKKFFQSIIKLVIEIIGKRNGKL